ncbi:methyltransferase domain-containing protein [Plectosphaerella plurivora]|uniref:Methyltransferase domain-containing protein n=1 Tax=Plectosphaerella plurivora TaxID=936078 RepID=A0A9P9A5U7_9PEZI|nr:methyltransferase domain-containing protein [Plectosphaerella plurivora]
MEVAPKLNRRVIQALWAAAVIVFIGAAFHMSAPAKEWAETKASTISNIVSSFQGGEKAMRKWMERSEANWAKTVRDRHQMIAADYPGDEQMPTFPAQDPASYKKHPYTVWDFMPATYSCPWHMERVGRMGDGGKWVCGMERYEEFPANRECVVYSFGVRDESSFEQEILSRTNCVVWAYDFTVVDFGEQLDARHRDRAHFEQVGIAGKTDTTKEPPFYSIVDLMKKNGHTYIDILKMDIEEAEFDAMDGITEIFNNGDQLPIGQLLMEMHIYARRLPNAVLEWWERLESRGLRPAWTEPNLLAVTLKIGPVMAEYTMVNVQDENSVIFKSL